MKKRKEKKSAGQNRRCGNYHSSSSSSLTVAKQILFVSDRFQSFFFLLLSFHHQNQVSFFEDFQLFSLKQGGRKQPLEKEQQKVIINISTSTHSSKQAHLFGQIAYILFFFFLPPTNEFFGRYEWCIG